MGATVRRSGKIVLYPNEKQKQQLLKTTYACRVAWNWCLDYHINYYKENDMYAMSGAIRNALNVEKNNPESPIRWLSDVSSTAVGNVPQMLVLAFKNFFRRTSGYPNKKYLNSDTKSFYVNPISLRLEKGRINVERCGKIKARQISGPDINNTKIYSPMCKIDCDKYIITFSYDVNKKDLPIKFNYSNVIGVDVGVSKLASLSNGDSFENINFTEKIKALKNKIYVLEGIKAKKARVRKNKRMKDKDIDKTKSKSEAKIDEKIKRLHLKIREINNNYQHNVSKKIVDGYDADKIVTETLLVKSLIEENNKHKETKALAEQIKETKMNQFLRFIEYKCEDKPVKLVKAPVNFESSKMCSNCGEINDSLNLTDRTFVCTSCGFTIDRDVNAARNLANL